MKIKLKPLNRGDKKGHHSDDLTDAVALKRMFPEGYYYSEGMQRQPHHRRQG